MKTLTILGAGVILSLSSLAQNEVDALRYSNLQYGGTARFNAMGGAFGALGGDFSSLSINPAGIAVYRKSELTFSPSFYNNSTRSTYYGNTVSDSKFNFNFGNIGWVANFSNGGSGFVSSSLGIGYNRINNFHRGYTVEATNTESSLIDIYLEDLSGIDASAIGQDPSFAFGSNMAWETFLVDTSGGNSTYVSAIPNYGERQRVSVVSNGSMGETVFSYGANYENKLYLGGTFGIQNISYYEITTHEETVAENDTTTTLDRFILQDQLRTSGVGYNFKFGMIYRPHDYVRLGIAVHTPSFFSLEDRWSSRMESDFENGDHYEINSPKGNFDYQLTTPFRAIGSLAIVFGKYGLVSADYEFVDYASARLRSNQYSFLDENNNVQSLHTATGNIKIGTEWKFSPFAVRGGWALYGDPYSSLAANNGSKQAFSAGFGIRDKGYFIDMGYVVVTSSDNIFFYDPSKVRPADVDATAHSFLVTIGLRY